MNRRDFLKTGTAAAVAVKTTEPARAQAKKKRPNILYVFSDQHRACSLPGEPGNQTIAPTFEAFRAENSSMDQCISNYPLCSPHRAIFMSGLYPQQTGMLGNYDVLDPSVGPLGKTFKDAGYHTGYVGKWHINGQQSISRADEIFVPKGSAHRMGFEDWHIWADTDDHYHSFTFNPETGEKISPEGWQPVRMTDQAIELIKTQPKEKPWFLVLSWNPPHPPFNPPTEEMTPYPLDKITFRQNVDLGSEGSDEHKKRSNEDALRKSFQGYMGGITGVDEQFARVLKALEETGQADNTIVIYTSDHGEMMGAQGLLGKRVPYEESCRVPFIVRDPNVATAKRHKSNVLFSSVDIYPTLCGLAGIPVPAHCAGRDLSEALRGRKIKEPEYVFMLSQPETQGSAAQQAEGKAGSKSIGGKMGTCPPYRGVRTKTHTYIVADTGRWLLYDNATDPYQMKNLVDDKSQQPLMTKLDAQIEAWLHTVKDSTFPYATAKKSLYQAS